LRGQRQAHSPSAGTAESQMPSRLSWGIGRAATLLKTLLQYFWQVFRGVARCCLPRFQGQPQHLKYQNRIKKIYIKKFPWLLVKSLTFPWQLLIPDISRFSRQVGTLKVTRFIEMTFKCYGFIEYILFPITVPWKLWSHLVSFPTYSHILVKNRKIYIHPLVFCEIPMGPPMRVGCPAGISQRCLVLWEN